MQHDLLLDVAELRRLRAQKLPSRRHIEEERADLDRGAARAAVIAHFDELSAVHFDLGADERVLFARGETKARHAGDAGHSLAAKAESHDGGEVVLCADLARRVAFQAQHRVLAIHAAAVIDDFEHRHAAALRVDLDVRGAGIEAVFHQLAHDGRRPLHDLARGDLAGQRVGEDADFRHGKKVGDKGLARGP